MHFFGGIKMLRNKKKRFEEEKEKEWEEDY